MPIFGRSQEEVIKRIGHPSQLGGLKPYILSDGRAAGVRAVDFRTTAGLEFTVLLDRAMDISEARYQGRSLCYRSPSGDTAPSFYHPRGLEWLRTFFCGLLSTCGLTNVGPPTTEPDQTGLHGRIGAVAAERVCLQEEWSEGSPLLRVSGLVREASLFGPALEAQRTITAKGDAAWLRVRDVITNAGARRSPCMLLYHINTGWPLIDEGTELILPCTEWEPRDADAEEGKDEWMKMHAPVYGYREKVYFHTLCAGAHDAATVGIINRSLGLGLRLRYRPVELPYFTEWKMMGEKEYTLGIEPGNCRPMGRELERAAGRLVELDPGEKIEAGFEIDVVEGAPALDALATEAADIGTAK